MTSPAPSRLAPRTAAAGSPAVAPPGPSRASGVDGRALLGALVLLAGGLLLVASELAEGSGIRLTLGTGLSLVAAGWVDRRRVLYPQMGFPVLGLGLGMFAADQVPVLAASVEPFVLGGLGAGLVAADVVSRGGAAWGASAVLVLAALGTVIVVATSPESSVLAGPGPPVAWWGLAATQVAVGAALVLGALVGWALPAARPPAPAPVPRAARRDRASVRQAGAGGVLVLGGVVTALIDLSRDSLVEILPALGAAYVVAGWVDGRQRRIDSGTALLALGLALKLDDVAVLTPYFEALVLGSFGVALLLLQHRRHGPHPGFGRSILTVGLVFAAIELLPEHVDAPGLWSAAYSGWLFAVLVAASGAGQVGRAWRLNR